MAEGMKNFAVAAADHGKDAVRVIEVLLPEQETALELPLFLESVSAGFPSPAEDYIEGKLDLNKYLVRNPSSTFLVRVTGDSMIGAGLNSGDLLVVDRSLGAKEGNIVIAVIDGELTVKRLGCKDGKLYLLPENSKYRPIEIKAEMQFEIWGVVTSAIHSVL